MSNFQTFDISKAIGVFLSTSGSTNSTTVSSGTLNTAGTAAVVIVILLLLLPVIVLPFSFCIRLFHNG